MKKAIIKLNDVVIDQSGSGSHDEIISWILGNSHRYPEGTRYFILDLTQDRDWLLSECHRNRMAEYPSLGDQMDAMYKGRKGDKLDLDSIDAKIAAVKLKYPKPTVTTSATEEEYFIPVPNADPEVPQS